MDCFDILKSRLIGANKVLLDMLAAVSLPDLVRLIAEYESKNCEPHGCAYFPAGAIKLEIANRYPVEMARHLTGTPFNEAFSQLLAQ